MSAERVSSPGPFHVFDEIDIAIDHIPVKCWILLPTEPAYTFVDSFLSDDLRNPRRGLSELRSEARLKDITAAARGKSDESNGTAERLPHTLAFVKEFFENAGKHETKEIHRPMHRVNSRISPHSSATRFENDSNYDYVIHIMQPLVVVRNKGDGSHVRFDSYCRMRRGSWKVARNIRSNSCFTTSTDITRMSSRVLFQLSSICCKEKC